ncbi:MAG: transcriptional repressor LexA [Bdellovibrionia bacterium]
MAKKNDVSSKSKIKSAREHNKSPLPPLTFKEKAVLEFIEAFSLSSGVSPSYQEIKEHFGFASFNSVQNYLKQLAQKGYIAFEAHQKRAIRVLQSASYLQEQMENLIDSVSTATGSSPTQLLQAREEVLSLPLLGKVAAGKPLESFSHDEYFDVPASYIKDHKQSFALKVQGQSMIEDGIHDGDVILIQKAETARNGEIVVAEIDGEATVKRFFAGPRPGSQTSEQWIELRPANSTMSSMWYHPQEVQIKGKVISLVRKF